MLQLYPIGTSVALTYGVRFLKQAGLDIVDHPTPEVTHLLLDVPSFRDGIPLEKILETLPPAVTVVGGNLSHPSLDGYRIWDLLLDEEYLARNAAITADCALQVAAPLLKTTFAQSPALIIGWGRIGKCLGQMLRGLGCQVTVAARSPRDRAMLPALGYKAAAPSQLPELSEYRLIFNTVPTLILPQEKLQRCKTCIKIDLASRRGIEGDDIVWARGLPGIHAPASSGKLIADTILRKLKEEKA